MYRRAESALTIILKSAMWWSDQHHLDCFFFFFFILIVLSTVNLWFQGQFVLISLRPAP